MMGGRFTKVSGRDDSAKRQAVRDGGNQSINGTLFGTRS